MTFRLSFLILAVSLAVGCRSNDARYELMQRELRLQEDRIYQLEDYIQQYQALLEASHLGTNADNPAGEIPAGEVIATPEPTPAVERRRGSRPSTPVPPAVDLGVPAPMSEPGAGSAPGPGAEPLIRPRRVTPPRNELLPSDPLPALPDFSDPSPQRSGRRSVDQPPIRTAAPAWSPNR